MVLNVRDQTKIMNSILSIKSHKKSVIDSSHSENAKNTIHRITNRIYNQLILIKGKQVWKFSRCLNVMGGVWMNRKVKILPYFRFIEFDHIIKPKPVIMKHIPTSKDLNDLPGWSILIHSQ